MSLLSRHQLNVLLNANEITFQHIKGWLSPHVHFQSQLSFKPSADDRWGDALEKIEILFSKNQLPKQTPIKFVIASECLRFLTLPAQNIVVAASEKSAYASAFYFEVYGERINEWEIRQDDAPPHLPSLSVAMDKGLLEALKKITDKYQLSLVTVEPYVMTAVNYLAKEIGKADGFLAIVENNRLVLLQLQAGHIVNFRIEAIIQDWQISLHQMLLRESLLAAEKSDAQAPEVTKPTVLLYAPHMNTLQINKIADWPITMIGGSLGQSSKTLSNAIVTALT